MERKLNHKMIAVTLYLYALKQGLMASELYTVLLQTQSHQQVWTSFVSLDTSVLSSILRYMHWLQTFITNVSLMLQLRGKDYKGFHVTTRYASSMP